MREKRSTSTPSRVETTTPQVETTATSANPRRLSFTLTMGLEYVVDNEQLTNIGTSLRVGAESVEVDENGQVDSFHFNVEAENVEAKSVEAENVQTSSNPLPLQLNVSTHSGISALFGALSSSAKTAIKKNISGFLPTLPSMPTLPSIPPIPLISPGKGKTLTIGVASSSDTNSQESRDDDEELDEEFWAAFRYENEQPSSPQPKKKDKGKDKVEEPESERESDSDQNENKAPEVKSNGKKKVVVFESERECVQREDSEREEEPAEAASPNEEANDAEAVEVSSDEPKAEEQNPSDPLSPRKTPCFSCRKTDVRRKSLHLAKKIGLFHKAGSGLKRLHKLYAESHGEVVESDTRLKNLHKLHKKKGNEVEIENYRLDPNNKDAIRRRPTKSVRFSSPVPATAIQEYFEEYEKQERVTQTWRQGDRNKISRKKG